MNWRLAGRYEIRLQTRRSRCAGMGEWTGVVNIENRIGRNRGRVLGILPF